jgi:hypothetical protein
MGRTWTSHHPATPNSRVLPLPSLVCSSESGGCSHSPTYSLQLIPTRETRDFSLSRLRFFRTLVDDVQTFQSRCTVCMWNLLKQMTRGDSLVFATFVRGTRPFAGFFVRGTRQKDSPKHGEANNATRGGVPSRFEGYEILKSCLQPSYRNERGQHTNSKYCQLMALADLSFSRHVVSFAY